MLDGAFRINYCRVSAASQLKSSTAILHSQSRRHQQDADDDDDIDNVDDIVSSCSTESGDVFFQHGMPVELCLCECMLFGSSAS